MARATAVRRPTVWRRLLAFGARWPVIYRRAHVLALCLLPFELLTGACLYFPGLHVALIRWLPAITTLHVWAGIAFSILLLLPVAVPLGRRALSAFDWGAVFWLVGGLAVTGLALWTGSGLIALLRTGAFGLHGALSVAILAWACYHGGVRLEAAWRAGDPERAVEPRQPLKRRDMLRQLGSGLGLSTFATAVFGTFGGSIGAVLGRAGAPLGAFGAPTTHAAATAAGTGTQPPGTPIPGFQIYTVTGGFPSFDPRTFRLSVGGGVAKPAAFSLTDLLDGLPQTTETRAFHCVTGWEVAGNVWRGVRIQDLLEAVGGTLPGHGWLTFHSFDGIYTDSLSLQQATADGVLLVTHANGQPLAAAQGAPLRLIVPQMYGYKSVKWVGRIALVRTRTLGYWEQRGYGPDAYVGTRDGWPAGQGPVGLW